MPLHTPSAERGCSCRQGPECPSAGKHPRILTGTDHENGSTDEGRIRLWWDRFPDANIGIVCGARSRLVIIDVDPRNDGVRPSNLPDTVQCMTGSGGSHDYYLVGDGDEIPRGRVFDEGVDFKAAGGMVVAPPSLHTSGNRYEWEASGHPDDIEPVRMPEWLREVGQGTKAREAPALASPDGIESGSRNSTLTRAAGALRRQGANEATIAAALQSINVSECIPQLPESEVAAIARSVTRYAPEPAAEPEKDRRPALTSGSHSLFNEAGDPTTIEVREDDFARDVLAKLAPGTLYRRGGVAGRLAGGAFRPVKPEEMVLVVAAEIALESRKLSKPRGSKAAPTESRKFEPCTVPRAALVRAMAGTSASVRDLKRMVPYPVYANFELVGPGWHEDSGTLCSYPERLNALPAAPEVIDDLLIDWPWATEADRQNAISMLFTIMLRPSISGNVPMFMVEASLERTGKTKLAGDLVGRLFLGKPTPAMQLAEREEEIDKRILAALMEGSPIMNLDNLGRRVTSPALAALLTSEWYTGRKLGASENLTLRNEMVLIGTGNNVAASAEIAKRIVPIRLHPPTSTPEARTDFVHPDLIGFIAANRSRILGTLAGLIDAWLAAGSPGSPKRLGGYENWASVVGGIMEYHGWTEWLANRAGWVGDADSDAVDLERFLDSWKIEFAGREVTSSDLVGVAERADLFPWVTEKRTASGRAASLAKGVLRDLRNRPTGEMIVRIRTVRNVSRYRLEKTPETLTTPTDPLTKPKDGVSGVERVGGLEEFSTQLHTKEGPNRGPNIQRSVVGTPQSLQPSQPHQPQQNRDDQSRGDEAPFDLFAWATERGKRFGKSGEEIIVGVARHAIGKEGLSSAEDEAACVKYLQDRGSL